MEKKDVEQTKNLTADFILLAIKVQKGNQINFKSKNLRETNLVLEACKKEYQKPYHENESLKSLPNNKRNCSNVKTS